MDKEDFRGVPVRNGLNKTMPLVHPIGAVAAATLCMPLLTGDREITCVLPSQGTTQGLPEARRLFAIIEADPKSFHKRLKYAFASCVHFVDHMPSAGSA